MSAWMDHLKKVMAENKGKSLKECMIIAKGSYKKPADGSVVKKAKKTNGRLNICVCSRLTRGRIFSSVLSHLVLFDRSRFSDSQSLRSPRGLDII